MNLKKRALEYHSRHNFVIQDNFHFTRPFDVLPSILHNFNLIHILENIWNTLVAYANFPLIRYSRPIVYQHRHINRAKLLNQIEAPKWICQRESQLEFGPRIFCNNTEMYYISVPFICRLISKHPIFGQSRCACMVIILSLIILCTLVLAHSMEKASLLVEE